MLSNPSLRTPTGYDIAVRYATPLGLLQNRVTRWLAHLDSP
jgi:hypothetical protein